MMNFYTNYNNGNVDYKICAGESQLIKDDNDMYIKENKEVVLYQNTLRIIGK